MNRLGSIVPIALLLGVISTTSHSQIVTDGSVGPASTLAGPDFAIGADLGAIHGANLFHSFSQFNIQSSESATFTGPNSIQNILSRVTGGNSSMIDGLLSSEIAGANLYLLNPAGVLFGPNADIDVGGAFVVSTADHIRLENGGRFDAFDPPASLLNADPVEAFGFVRDDPASVSIDGSVIRADAGRNISVIAGDIEIADAELRTEGGNLSLVSVGSTGEVTNSQSSHDTQSFSTLGDIDIYDFALLDANGESGGRIVLQANNIVVEDSVIVSRTYDDGAGAGIDLIAMNQLDLLRSRIDTSTRAAGAAGPISIRAVSLTLDNRDALFEAGIFADSLAEPRAATNFADIQLTLNITHPVDSDVAAIIQSPNGTEALLFSRVGGSGQDFTDTTFDDAADESIAFGAAPFTGSFRPTVPLASLLGESADGQWTLGVADFTEGDSGTLDSWSLTISGQTFTSSDIPKDIEVLPAFGISTIEIDAPGLTIELDQGFSPGAPGNIDIVTESLNVFGDLPLSATAVAPDTVRRITLTSPAITLDGADAHLELGADGVGQFVEGLPSIVLDGTLAAASILTGPHYQISPDFGEVVGTNLFHSFASFSLASGESAVFSGPSSISNVLARVTGDDPSVINGIVRSEIDGAALFIINPVGMIFGPDSVLDVGGSITLSTADHIFFDDSGRFDATTPGSSSLTSALPSAFGFIDDEPGSIIFSNATLSVTDGPGISLIVGDIVMNGSDISTGGGDIVAVSVGASGVVSVAGEGPTATVDLRALGELGEILLLDGSALDTDGEGGGRILIRGDTISVEDSQITARTLGVEDGHGVDIAARGQFDLIGSRVDTRTMHQGDAGDVIITAESIVFDNRGAGMETGILTDSTADPDVFSFADFGLTLDITHTFDGDLQATLRSPEGTDIQLFSRIGGAGDNFDQTNFVDSAETPINSGIAPFAGSFRPAESFDGIVGENANGIWTLTVADLAGGDDGQLESWSLTIGGTTVPSSDVPKDISNTLPPAASELTVAVPGLMIELIDPGAGAAGTIDIAAQTLEVFDGAALSDTVFADGATDQITLAIDTITLDGSRAHPVRDDNGVMRFVPSLSNIVLDGTLGDAPTLFGPVYEIDSSYGQIAGVNLFHSFSEFSLALLETAVFSGPTDIHRVIARVTGGEPSGINGTIQNDIADAELYLLNPAGVMFGPSASLELGGAVFITTADSIGLHDGGRFDATVLSASVLTAGTPATFGFVSENPASLSLESTTIMTQHNLSFLSGDVDFDNAIIDTSGSDVTIISVGSVGEITPEVGDSGAFLTVESFSGLGDVVIANDTVIDASGTGGGRVAIRSGNLDIVDSEIASRTIGSSDGRGVDFAVVGDIQLELTDIFSITTTTGKAGMVDFSATNIHLNAATIVGDTTGAGQGGDIALNVDSDIDFLDNASITSDSLGTDMDAGNAGTIEITAGSVNVGGASFVSGNTTGAGTGTVIRLNVVDALAMHTGGIIRADSVGDAAGNGGDIVISAGSVEIVDAFISTNTSGGGDGGDIDLTVANGVVVRSPGTSIVSRSTGEQPDAGDSGSITVNAGSIIVDDRGFILTSTFGPGNGGDIHLTVVDELIVRGANTPIVSRTNGAMDGAGDGGNIIIDAGSVNVDAGFVSTTSFGPGNSGLIEVSADSMVVGGAGFLSATTRGTGDAGILRLDISNNLAMHTGGFINTDSIGDSAGDSGRVSITAGSVVLDSGFISTNTSGAGGGGDIDLAITGELLITTPGSSIVSRTTGAMAGAGDSGNITIAAGSAVIEGGTFVSVSTFGLGNGGEIMISTQDALTLNGANAAIVSRTNGAMEGAGDGGNITVSVGSLDVIDGFIGAESFGPGEGGGIEVNSDLMSVGDLGSLLVTTSSSGNAGTIQLNIVHELSVQGSISADTASGIGSGGDISITAASAAIISGRISTASSGPGEGGDISVTLAANLEVRDGGVILSESRGEEAAAGDGGTITITADSAILEEDAFISVDTFGPGDAGDLILEFAADLQVSFDSFISSASLGDDIGAGDAGTISIVANSATISDDGFIAVDTCGPGIGGDVTVVVGAELVLRDGGSISTDSFGEEIGAGGGGRILVEAGSLVVSSGSFITSDTFGPGTGGDVMVDVAGDVTVRDAGFISTDSLGEGMSAGDGGAVMIISNRLFIEDGGVISASTNSNGDGGDVAITTYDSLTIRYMDDDLGGINRNGVFTVTRAIPGLDGGNAGNITIHSGNVFVSDLGTINSSTIRGSGRGGTITIEADEAVILESFGIVAAISSSGGPAGSVDLTADRLVLRDGSKIAVTSSGEGPGGTIDIDAATIEIRGDSDAFLETLPADVRMRVETRLLPLLSSRFSSIESASLSTAENAGQSGVISIDAGRLQLDAAGTITTSSAGGGASGSIMIGADTIQLDTLASIASRSTGSGNAGDTGSIRIGTPNDPVATLQLAGGATITTDAASAGGGQISVYARDLVYLLDSQITTSVADGFGFGGDIFIDPINVVLNNSQILAQAFAGDGGAITIIADNFIQSNNSLVDATSARGNNGTIEIVAPDTDINADLVPLLGDFLDAASWVVERCSARLGGSSSSLTLTGRGGVPSSLGDLQSNLEIIGSEISSGSDTNADKRKVRALPTIGSVDVAEGSGCRGCE